MKYASINRRLEVVRFKRRASWLLSPDYHQLIGQAAIDQGKPPPGKEVLTTAKREQLLADTKLV